MCVVGVVGVFVFVLILVLVVICVEHKKLFSILSNTIIYLLFCVCVFLFVLL